MSKKYSITEARSNLPKIVDQAEAGTEVELTRRGKPVAVIISHRQMERLRSERPRFADVYKAFLRRHSLKDVGVEDDFLQAARENPEILKRLEKHGHESAIGAPIIDLHMLVLVGGRERSVSQYEDLLQTALICHRFHLYSRSVLKNGCR